MNVPQHDLIKRRAYEIWEASGSPHGQDKEHWAQAEKEFLSLTGEAAPAPRKGTLTVAKSALPTKLAGKVLKARPKKTGGRG